MSGSAKTYLFTVQQSAIYALRNAPRLGPRILEAIENFERGRQPQAVWENSPNYRREIIATVIGSSLAEEATCFVVQEHSGGAVRSDAAEQAHLDAMVKTLRAHGYTCIRRGEQ